MITVSAPVNLGDQVSTKEGLTFSLKYGAALDTLISIFKMRETKRPEKWPLVLISEDGDVIGLLNNKLEIPIICNLEIHHGVEFSDIKYFEKLWRIDVPKTANDFRYKLKKIPIFLWECNTVGQTLKDYRTYITIYSDPPSNYTGDSTRYKVGSCLYENGELISDGSKLIDTNTKIYYFVYDSYNKLSLWVHKEDLMNYTKEEVK